MTGLLVACIVLLSAVLTALVVAVVISLRRLGRSAGQIEETLKIIREDIGPLAADARRTLENADTAISSVRVEVERISGIIGHVEHFIEASAVIGAAERAVSSSKVTLVSVVEGLKQGLKVLRSARSDSKEETDNEQQ